MTTPTLEHVAPHALALYHRNPRRGDVSAIRASLRAHGQYKPLLVNRGTHTGRAMEVLAGNHTLMAIRDLAEEASGDALWATVAVYVIDVDDDEAARVVAVDNRTAELGGFDDEALAELLRSLPDGLDGTGYDNDDLADLLARIEESTPVYTDPIGDDNTDAPRPPRTGEDGIIASKDIGTQGDEYAEQATRLVVLTLPIPQFIWAQTQLSAYRAEVGVETNSAALLELLAAWAGERPPAADAPVPEAAPE